MRLTIQRSELLPALTRAASVADQKSTMPILGCVLLDGTGDDLRIAATNLQQAIECRLAVEVTGRDAVAVGARTLLDRVKALPDGEVTLETAKTGLVVKSGSRRFTVHTVPAEDYPALPTRPEAGSEVRAGCLLSAIEGSGYAVSTDETRAHLNSLLLEFADIGLRAVATDGHRLAVTEVSGGSWPGWSVLVPKRAVDALKRIAEECEVDDAIGLAVDGYTMFASVPGCTYSARLSESQFPPYKAVIPETSAAIITVDRKALLESVRAVAVSASQRTGGIKLTFDGDGRIVVETESPDTGDALDAIECDYMGSKRTIGVSARYLAEALSSMTAEKVEIGTSGDLDPLLVTPDGDKSQVACVMPMKI
jgi:DNA polymerase-3 subunit beta